MASEAIKTSKTMSDGHEAIKKPWQTPKVTAAAPAEEALKISGPPFDVESYYGPS